jgi:hypothetical protein
MARPRSGQPSRARESELQHPGVEPVHQREDVECGSVRPRLTRAFCPSAARAAEYERGAFGCGHTSVVVM